MCGDGKRESLKRSNGKKPRHALNQPQPLKTLSQNLVELVGIEPTTSSLRTMRACRSHLIDSTRIVSAF